MSSEPPSTFASATSPTRYPNFRFHHVDVENRIYNISGRQSGAEAAMPHEDGSADLVQSWSLYTHFVTANMRNYVRLSASMLRSGGLFANSFFVLPDDHKIGGRPLAELDDGCWTTDTSKPEACTVYSRDMIVDALTAAGLELIEIHGRDSSSAALGQDVVLARKR